MNIEFFRRERSKKIMGLTELPTDDKPVTIAKGLETIDFVGMMFETNEGCEMIMTVGAGDDGSIGIFSTNFSFNYDPKTGELRIA